MLFCLGRRKLATLLTALCLIAMLMSINKYLSSDNNSNNNNDDDQNSKMKAYYPFDDTGQVRTHQHLTNKDKHKFKAWQINPDDEDKGDFKHSNLRNVIQAPNNGDSIDSNKVEHEVVIRDFNNHNNKDNNYAFHNGDISITTSTESYVVNRRERKKDLNYLNYPLMIIFSLSILVSIDQAHP